jgi:HK97 family phage major capsid protein
MASLVNNEKQNDPLYATLEQSVGEIDQTIATIRQMMAMPSYQSIVERQATEERDRQTDAVVQQTASAVTAAIITSDKSGEKRAIESQLRTYLRNGNITELRDVTVTGDSGALLPQEFAIVASATKYVGRIAQEVYQYNAEGGRSVKFPVSDDTANGMTVIAETNSSNPAEADPTVFSTTNPGADDLVGRVDYSKQFADDSIAGYLQRLIGPRVARALSSAVMVGKDTAGNALVNAPAGGYLAGIPVGATTGTIAASIGIDDLENLYASLDYSYQVSGSWFMHQKTRDLLQSQKDSTGRSLYGVSPQEGLVNLLSRPVYIDNNLPAPSAGVFGASVTPVIFGDHSKAFGASISVSVRSSHLDMG